MSCRNAYEAARLSAVVIKSRAQVTIEPSPFFQTRVMAALREQQAVDSVPAMFRLWKWRKYSFLPHGVTTAARNGAKCRTPRTGSRCEDQVVSAYSAESVIMGQASDELSYEQVLSTIYAEEEETR